MNKFRSKSISFFIFGILLILTIFSAIIAELYKNELVEKNLGLNIVENNIFIITITVGAIFSFLIFGFLYELSSSNSKALIFAEKLTLGLKKSKEDLFFERNRLYKTLQSIGDGVIATDIEGKITLMNHCAEKLTGWEEEVAKGKPLEEVFRTNKELKNLCYKNPSIKSDANCKNCSPESDVRLLRKDGSEKAVSHCCAPIQDEKNNIMGSVLIFRDITERKRMEEGLKQTTEMKLQFVSNVSHELRTPLTIIRESISLIDEEIGAKLASQQKDLLDICNRNIDRLARLISDILDFQKLQSGKAVFELKENDINDTILEVTQTMNTLLKDKNLKFSTDLDLRVPKLKYDKDKIIQVLTNIVNNAIKFTENGEIEILSQKRGNSVIVSVKDTGIGIKKDEIQKLFVPFAQLESSNERRRGGTGLGLSISKEIIEKHNGKIWVESSLGNGSTFNFTIPIIERRGVGFNNEKTNIIGG